MESTRAPILFGVVYSARISFENSKVSHVVCGSFWRLRVGPPRQQMRFTFYMRHFRDQCKIRTLFTLFWDVLGCSVYSVRISRQNSKVSQIVCGSHVAFWRRRVRSPRQLIRFTHYMRHFRDKTWNPYTIYTVLDPPTLILFQFWDPFWIPKQSNFLKKNEKCEFRK